MKKWIKMVFKDSSRELRGSAMFDWILDLNVQCFNKSKKTVTYNPNSSV